MDVVITILEGVAVGVILAGLAWLWHFVKSLLARQEKLERENAGLRADLAVLQIQEDRTARQLYQVEARAARLEQVGEQVVVMRELMADLEAAVGMKVAESASGDSADSRRIHRLLIGQDDSK